MPWKLRLETGILQPLGQRLTSTVKFSLCFHLRRGFPCAQEEAPACLEHTRTPRDRGALGQLVWWGRLLVTSENVSSVGVGLAPDPFTLGL